MDGFLKKYAVVLESAVGYEDDDSNFKKDMINLGGVSVYLKKLSVFTDELSPVDVLVLLRSGKVTSQEGLLMLDAAIGRFTSEVGDKMPSDYIPALVSIAQQKSTLKKQVAFLSRLESWVQKKTLPQWLLALRS